MAFAVGAALAQETEPPPPVTVSVSTTAPENLYLASETIEAGAPIPLLLRFTNNTDEELGLKYTYVIADYWGQPVDLGGPGTVSVAGKQSAERKHLFKPAATGAYDVSVQIQLANMPGHVGAAAPLGSPATIGIVPGPVQGLRPESFFASNTGDKGHNEFDRRLGLKVFRQHWADEWGYLADASRQQDRPVNAELKFDFARQDEYYQRAQQSDLSILGIVGYANPDWARTQEARNLNMYGPPRDFDEFVRATIPCVQHYPQIKYWEFWNEPWIYGWTWAASGSEYRRLQKMWCQAAKQARPDLKIIVGHSASHLVDHIALDPSCYQGLVDADSNHPYKEGQEPSWRLGSQLRYTDYGVQEAEKMGIHQHFITENGTEVPGQRDHPLNAAKIPALHALAALAGIYQANVQEGIGWGPEQMKGAVAYGVMTHFLEDRPLVADIWPAHPLIWGAIFANPKLADRSLPRADQIDARWSLPGREGDTTKVAMLWCYTGPDDRHLDRDGTIAITPAGDLRAFSLMGEPKGARKGDSLMVAFNQYPIYLLSDELSVTEMRRRIADGRIEHVTPLNLSMYSFTKPLAGNPDLVVRVQNQLNRPLKGQLTVKLPKGWAARQASRPFELGPADIGEVRFALVKAVANELNQYPITIVANTDAGKTERTQIVCAAYAGRRRIKVDGSLDDWQSAVPAVIDSAQIAQQEDYTYYLLNPNRPRPQGPDKTKHIICKAYTAYDDQRFYLAFEVKEPSLAQKSDSNTANHTLPWYSGDCIEFAFGLRERAEDDYRQPADPYYWKGIFRDTDYQYLVMQASDGPCLIRLHKPGMKYTVPFQTETIPGGGPVPAAQLRINRNQAQQLTVYELSLPLSELALLKPGQRDQMRFGFIVCNDEGAGRLQWSQAAGVFDYWLNNGSYMPTWESFWPCQTKWGLVREGRASRPPESGLVRL